MTHIGLAAEAEGIKAVHIEHLFNTQLC